jgi:hypothetical protein
MVLSTVSADRRLRRLDTRTSADENIQCNDQSTTQKKSGRSNAWAYIVFQRRITLKKFTDYSNKKNLFERRWYRRIFE